MARRILAIVLLFAFGSPLVQPLLAAAASPEASLPACCRSHGAHRCAMLHLRSASTGPAFKAPPCPFYPAAATLPQLAAAGLAAPPAASIRIALAAAAHSQTPQVPRTLLVAANPKRGPPALLA